MKALPTSIPFALVPLLVFSPIPHRAIAGGPADSLKSSSLESNLARIGVIEGAVTSMDSDSTRSPLASANVVVLNSRLGSGTDGAGRFLIHGVPEGLHHVACRSLGHTPETLAVRVAAGETTRVSFLVRAGEVRIGMRNFRPPSPHVLERVRRARDVEVYRLNPRDEVWSEPGLARRAGDRLGPWKIVRKTGPPDRMWAQELAAVLVDTTSWIRGWRGIKPCIPEPGVGVRFRGPGGTTDFEFCLECGMAFAQTDGVGVAGGEFNSSSGGRMLGLFVKAFPGDEGLRAPAERHRAPERRR